MFNFYKTGLVAVAAVGMIIPGGAAAGSVAPMETTADVRLVAGVMQGRVVSATGQPVETTVEIMQADQNVASAETDANGIYRVSGLETGDYTVSTAAGSARVRAWGRQAPPTAVDALVISEGQIVRGNHRGNGFKSGLHGTTGNVVLAATAVVGIVATTVAIAEANNNNDAPPVSP